MISAPNHDDDSEEEQTTNNQQNDVEQQAKAVGEEPAKRREVWEVESKADKAHHRVDQTEGTVGSLRTELAMLREEIEAHREVLKEFDQCFGSMADSMNRSVMTPSMKYTSAAETHDVLREEADDSDDS